MRISTSGPRKQQILRTAVELLAEHGYDRLTFDALAHAARTSKASLYRHWPSKFQLVVDAMAEQVDRQGDFDLGSLRADLRATILDKDSLFQPVPFAAMNATMAALPRESSSTAEFVRTFWDENPHILRIWDRALERGEVAADGDRDLLFSALFYGVYHLTVLRAQPLDPAAVDRVLDHLVLPAAAHTKWQRTSTTGDAGYGLDPRRVR